MTCCVPNCNNSRKKKEPGVKLYNFPHRHSYDAELRQRWIEAINRRNRDGSVWQPNKVAVICSKHFQGGRASTIWSHPNSVPSIFPEVSETNRRKRAANLGSDATVEGDRVEAEDAVSCSVECEIDPGIEVKEEEEAETIPDRLGGLSSQTDSTTRFANCNTQVSATNCLRAGASLQCDFIIKEEPVEVERWFVEYEIDPGNEVDVKAEDPLCVDPLGDATQMDGVARLTKSEPCIGNASSSEHSDRSGDAEEKPFACDMCGFRGAQAANFRRHLMTHIPYRDKPYSCSSCEFRSDRKDALERHMMKHVDYRLYPCNKCKHSSKTKRDLKRHQLKHGVNSKPFACDMCDYRASQAGNLRRHKITHKTDRDKPYRCSQCEYRSERGDKLDRHMMKHIDDRPYSCKKCEYFSKTEEELKKHQRRMHGGDKPLACSLCEFRAIFKYELEIHMRIHTGERPFPCKYERCNFSARTKWTLTAHYKTHSGERNSNKTSGTEEAVDEEL